MTAPAKASSSSGQSSQEPTLKTIKIGIASLNAYRARTLAIARGEFTPRNDDPKIWFASAESFAHVLIAKDCTLLTKIGDQQLDPGEEPWTGDSAAT